MQKLIFILLICFLPCCHIAAQTQKFSLKEMNLKGRVKEISEISYKTVDNNGKTEKAARTGNAAIIFFNGNGSMISRKWFDSDGSLSRKDTCKYDDNGHLVEMNWYYPDGKLERKTTYAYDSSNQRLIETKSYKGDGNLDERSVFRYAKNRNMIDELIYDKNGDRSGSKNFQYDSLWNLSQESINTFTFFKNVYKYDDNGNVLEKIRSDTGPGSRTYTYKYENDRTGNWIKKDELMNGASSLITERVITYF
jgi:hypothetical protein